MYALLEKECYFLTPNLNVSKNYVAYVGIIKPAASQSSALEIKSHGYPLRLWCTDRTVYNYPEIIPART